MPQHSESKINVTVNNTEEKAMDSYRRIMNEYPMVVYPFFTRDLAPSQTITNALIAYDSLDIMDLLFSSIITRSVRSNMFPAEEDDELNHVLRESMEHYNTQEKKPNIEINVSSQPASPLEENTCCAICQSQIELDESITILECTHILHENCVSEWVKYKPECPVCRKEISVIDTQQEQQHPEQVEEEIIPAENAIMWYDDFPPFSNQEEENDEF